MPGRASLIKLQRLFVSPRNPKSSGTLARLHRYNQSAPWHWQKGYIMPPKHLQDKQYIFSRTLDEQDEIWKKKYTKLVNRVACLLWVDHRPLPGKYHWHMSIRNLTMKSRRIIIHLIRRHCLRCNTLFWYGQSLLRGCGCRSSKAEHDYESIRPILGT